MFLRVWRSSDIATKLHLFLISVSYLWVCLPQDHHVVHAGEVEWVTPGEVLKFAGAGAGRADVYPCLTG